jgi:hypothetical protein
MNEGQSIRSLAVRVKQPFSDEDYDLARRTILECCRATKRGRSRNAAGKIVYIEEPDYPVRLAAAVRIAEFVGGKPVAMNLHADLTPNQPKQSQDEFFAGVLKDRAAVEALRETFDKIVEAAEKVGPIDVPATPVLSPPKGPAALAGES